MGGGVVNALALPIPNSMPGAHSTGRQAKAEDVPLSGTILLHLANSTRVIQ